MEPERPSATTARSSVTFLDEATGPAISGVARHPNRREFWHARPRLIRHLAPFPTGGRCIVLSEGGADPSGNKAALGLACIGQSIARKMDAASQGGVEDF